MRTQAQMIKATVKSLAVQAISKEKSWTKQQAADNVLGWLTCGVSISLYDYLMGA